MRLADYERELQQAKAKLDDVTARVQALYAEQEELTAVVRAWQVLANRERKQPEYGMPPQDGSPARENGGSIEPEAASSPDLVEALDEDEGAENKTQFVRDQIRANATHGMTPADLKRAADVIGMPYPTSWPYGPLQRLKQKGEIVKRKGRFYPSATPEAQSQPGLAGLALVS